MTPKTAPGPSLYPGTSIDAAFARTRPQRELWWIPNYRQRMPVVPPYAFTAVIGEAKFNLERFVYAPGAAPAQRVHHGAALLLKRGQSLIVEVLERPSLMGAWRLETSAAAQPNMAAFAFTPHAVPSPWAVGGDKRLVRYMWGARLLREVGGALCITLSSYNERVYPEQKLNIMIATA